METGVVFSRTELSGPAPASDWARWVGRGKAPGWDPAVTVFDDSWPEDLELMASLGLSSVVFVLDWARLEPRPQAYQSPEIELHRQMLGHARQLGLKVWACLIDQALPGWFAEDEGGFGDDRSRQLTWPRHIDWIGETFGDLVDGWIPQREPAMTALRGNLWASAPPGRSDLGQATKAVRANLLAEGEAWRLLAGTAPVATFQTARSLMTEGENIKAQRSAQSLRSLLIESWLVALNEGVISLPGLPDREVPHLRDSFDRVIVALRAPLTVSDRYQTLPYPSGHSAGPSGLVAWPPSMEENLRLVADRLPGRDVIGAGSLADVVDDGQTRADHIASVLELTSAAQHETGVVGWWQTSPIDAYHWNHGHHLKPGLVTSNRSLTGAATRFQELA